MLGSVTIAGALFAGTCVQSPLARPNIVQKGVQNVSIMVIIWTSFTVIHRYGQWTLVLTLFYLVSDTVGHICGTCS